MEEMKMEEVAEEEYFEYLDEVFEEEPNFFDAMLALCFQYGLSTDEAIDAVNEWFNIKEETDDE